MRGGRRREGDERLVSLRVAAGKLKLAGEVHGEGRRRGLVGVGGEGWRTKRSGGDEPDGLDGTQVTSKVPKWYCRYYVQRRALTGRLSTSCTTSSTVLYPPSSIPHPPSSIFLRSASFRPVLPAIPASVQTHDSTVDLSDQSATGETRLTAEADKLNLGSLLLVLIRIDQHGTKATNHHDVDGHGTAQRCYRLQYSFLLPPQESVLVQPC